MNFSPCGALSLSLNCSGRGPKRFLEANGEPLRVSLDVSCELNFSRTVSRKATRLATKAAVRYCEALREVCAAMPITSINNSNAGDSQLFEELAENSSFDNFNRSTINVNSLSIIMKSYMTTLNKESTLHDGEDLIPMGLESAKAKESDIALSNGLASTIL